MSVLLDTHALLWALEDNPRLGTRARSVLNDPREVKFLSIASAWEMAIKQSLGKLKLAMPVERVISERVLPLGVQLLGVQPSHLGRVDSLPFHHRDPFDRMLVAQALAEGFRIASVDPVFDTYGITRIW